ncbi:MAG: hypothetical protein B9S33_15785 [Pedosphaera sp. Tous-C6FEB]|nr:MAG: hypothetical protein B9S33_15785 [Pedosphaera sp. Tous-C6FEB]
MKISSLLSLAMLTAGPLWGAALTESKFSQVVKDVKVVARETETVSVAKVNDTFKSPDLIRTGADSLAELIAPDKTVTRVGANTVFSFEKSGRAINLEQGSVLFHSPKGKGGGTIKTKGASAAVLGTTIVVTATAGGGFKAIVLEGKGQITLPNGSFRILTAGQVTFVLPGAQRFGPQLNINLSKLVDNSRLVQGFEQDLPSKPVILEAIERQLTLLNTGVAEDTRLLVGNQATESTVETVDTSVLERIVDTLAERLARAKATDLVINTSDLRNHPNHLFLDRVPLDFPALGLLNFTGLVGKNVTVAPGVSALDFTPFLNQSEFVIAATDTLHLQTAVLQLSATLPAVGTPALQKVTLGGRAGLTIEPGAYINAFHIGELKLVTDGAMNLNNVSFANSGGKLHLSAGQTLGLNAGGISATPSMTLEGAAVSLSGGSYNVTGSALVDANGTTLNTSRTTFNGENVSLQASTLADLHSTTVSATMLANLDSSQDLAINSGRYSGASVQASAGRDLSVSSAEFQGPTVNLNAGRDATLSSPTVSGFTTLNVTAVRNLSIFGAGSFNGAPGVANFTAGDTLAASGTMANVTTISLSARTVNLSNITFAYGSTVNLYCDTGNLAGHPNTGAASVPGHVNFIVNVNYGDGPAQNFNGSFIQIHARP